jgi:pyruvate dehydrogenase E1 component alpha subunit
MKGLDRVSLCFFGDGAAAEGTFHESLNLAAVWKLPAVYVCENNGYGELTAIADACAVSDIASRAAGYSMPGVIVDGQDVLAVYAAVREAVQRARAGDGPSLVETKTYRYHGHAGGPESQPNYRSLDEVERWQQLDPITLFADRLAADHGFTRAELTMARDDEQALLEAAWEFARNSPYPAPGAAYDHLFSNPLVR